MRSESLPVHALARVIAEDLRAADVHSPRTYRITKITSAIHHASTATTTQPTKVSTRNVEDRATTPPAARHVW